MKILRRLTNFGIRCGIVVTLIGSVCAAGAPAQSVHGFGKVPSGFSFISPSEVAVDAWLDQAGTAQGTIAFTGGVSFEVPTGIADPWRLEVTDIVFDGNTAYVTAVVVHSVFPNDIGFETEFVFTDNSGTGDPDEIGGVPIVAGNITVTD